MKTLPKLVRFVKFHWRHCRIVDNITYKQLYEASQQFGAEHAAAMTGSTLVSPEQQCKDWLKANGYTFKESAYPHDEREIWQLTTAESVQ